MIRSTIAIFDLIHLAANIAFFVIGFNIQLTPAAAFIYMPLALLGIWSAFFGFRYYLMILLKASEQQTTKTRATNPASRKPLTTVLES